MLPLNLYWGSAFLIFYALRRMDADGGACGPVSHRSTSVRIPSFQNRTRTERQRERNIYIYIYIYICIYIYIYDCSHNIYVEVRPPPFFTPRAEWMRTYSVSICMSTPHNIFVEVPPQCSEMDANDGAGGPVSRRVTSIRIPYFTIRAKTIVQRN
jgi:hypothetical protein